MKLAASDFALMDEGQRVAVLETMVIGLIADNRITPGELRRFDEIVLELPWGVEREVLSAMIRGAKDRVTALKTPSEIQDYLVELGTRLSTPELREKLVFTLATLMLSDGELVQLEKNVLGLFVVAFGITSDRAAAIREALQIPAKPQTAPPPPRSN
jgi:hypothetical protein